MPFNLNKCQILQVGSRNIKNSYEMHGTKIKRVHLVKDLAITVTSNLKFSQQCNEFVKKSNRMMSLIKRKFSLKNKDVILSLLSSILRPHLEYTVQFWSAHHATVAKFENVSLCNKL